jgi:hypothetical protein
LAQANEVLNKIRDEFMPLSPILREEIISCKIGQTGEILFANRSWIKTRTSTDNSRSARANVIVVDEFRMVNKHIIDTVIREFLKSPRRPGYLNKPEYRHLKERNIEIYLSSAYYKSSWVWEKAKDYTANFLDDNKKYFICGLPYEISIREGLLMRSQVEDQISENDFDPIAFSMEDECLFYGDTDGSLYKYDDINKIRKIKDCILPLEFYNDKFKVPDKPVNGHRILSIDVALMASTRNKDNDATSININDLVLSDATSFQSNFKYSETFEGLTTDSLGIIIMRYFYHYKCDYIALDTNGLGLGVYDFIIKDQYDTDTGETYKALTCCNDDEMAKRCRVKDANKVIWSMKGSSALNNEICVLLRNGIQNGKINFLISEYDADDALRKTYKGFDNLSLAQQNRMKNPYIQTTLAEYELIKLGFEIVGNNIKVKEQSGMRKDRYSSIAYNYYVACQLELELKPKNNNDDTKSLVNKFYIKKGIW